MIEHIHAGQPTSTNQYNRVADAINDLIVKVAELEKTINEIRGVLTQEQLDELYSDNE